MDIIISLLLLMLFTGLGIFIISIINILSEKLQDTRDKNMKLFQRKKEQIKNELHIEFKEPKHECIMKDFPWYMQIWYSGQDKTAGYRIIEPYVCVECGKREDKILESLEWTNINADEREKSFKEIRERYKKYLKPKAVVEDMINDVLMVKDPDHLQMIEKLRGLPHSGCGSSSKNKKDDTEFAIHLEEKK